MVDCGSELGTETINDVCTRGFFWGVLSFGGGGIRSYYIMVDSPLLGSFTLIHKVMKRGMAPSLPQIRVSDMEILSEWDFENVKAFGDSIPGYRSSASMSIQKCA